MDDTFIASDSRQQRARKSEGTRRICLLRIQLKCMLCACDVDNSDVRRGQQLESEVLTLSNFVASSFPALGEGRGATAAADGEA